MIGVGNLVKKKTIPKFILTKVFHVNYLRTARVVP